MVNVWRLTAPLALALLDSSLTSLMRACSCRCSSSTCVCSPSICFDAAFWIACSFSAARCDQ